jgi:gliding motility-associated-like protein
MNLMNLLLRRINAHPITTIFIFILAHKPLSVSAQKIVDACFTSVDHLGGFGYSDDLVNMCSCEENSIASDLLEWDGDSWAGKWEHSLVDIPPPAGCNSRAIWMGSDSWTEGGEGFALRLDKPLVGGETYTFTFTYASDGIYSDGKFAPMVYTSKAFPLLYFGEMVGRLPAVGYNWTTNSITFKLHELRDGDNWIIISAYESSGIVLSQCEIERPITLSLLTNDTTLCKGDNIRLQSKEGKGFSYKWSTGSTAPSILVKEPGTYSVSITNHTCTSTDSVTVSFEDCEVRMEMPNIFTPNSDSKNNRFIPIESNQIIEGTVVIYNRWGDIVFSGDLFEGWNGTINSQEAASGVYYYKITYTDSGEKFHSKQGHVTLVR